MAKPRLLDQVREAVRVRHYSIRTEEAYLHWIKRFILFHNKRHPAEMGEPEIVTFLAHIAVDKHVSCLHLESSAVSQRSLRQLHTSCKDGLLEVKGRKMANFFL